MTKQQIISDVILQLTQASPSDDLELEEDQVAFWVTYSLNMLVAIEINSKLSKRESIPSVYIKKASCKVAEVEDTECTDDCADRIFVELEDGILTLNDDAGIIEIETDQGDMVKKASVETLHMFKHLRFAKPSEENLVYTHEGSKIYIEGLKAVDLPFDKLNIWYVPQQNLLDLADTDEVLASDLVLPQVIDLAVERGKFELYGTQPDTENDGVDYKKTMYHTAISNPVQPAQ
jgi:hypothetical protein